MTADPFAALGLAADADLSDDDVRAAWRRLAAATHPDRADGGDPARFATAAAAYTLLRTRSGRGEALADLTAPAPPPRRTPPPGQAAPDAAPSAVTGRAVRAGSLAARIRHGRPGPAAGPGGDRGGGERWGGHRGWDPARHPGPDRWRGHVAAADRPA